MQAMDTSPAPQRAEEPMRCLLCFDEVCETPLLACAEGHAMHSACFDAYVLSETEKLKDVSFLAAKADSARIEGNLVALDELTGARCCPLRGHGCKAGAFSDRLVCKHVSDTTFERYLEGKALLPIAKTVEQRLQEGNESATLVPNAVMCGRCKYGPVEPFACADLLAHHGEERGGSTLSNACPECGWFATDVSEWPRYDPNARTAADRAHWSTVRDDRAREDASEAAARRAEEARAAREEMRRPDRRPSP